MGLTCALQVMSNTTRAGAGRVPAGIVGISLACRQEAGVPFRVLRPERVLYLIFRESSLENGGGDCYWQPHLEGASLAHLAVNRNLSPVRLDDLCDQC